MSSFLSAIDWQAWASPLAIFFGAQVAIISIWQARRTAKQKAAVDWIVSSHANETLEQGLHEIIKLHHSEDEDIAKYAHLKPGDDATILKSLYYVLNAYEYLAVGIRHKIYDEATIKQSSYTSITELWSMAKPFVVARRSMSRHNTLYCELEWLAARWELSPLKKRPRCIQLKILGIKFNASIGG